MLDDDSDDKINNKEDDHVDYVLTEHINESLLEEKEDLVLIMREIVTLNQDETDMIQKLVYLQFSELASESFVLIPLKLT